MLIICRTEASRITIFDMRIGIDARLPFYRMGGISQYILHLLPALAELDETNQYKVFHSRKDQHTYVPGSRRFSRSNLWTPCHHKWERAALAVELIPHRLDVLHSPDFIPPFHGAKRRVITVHDLNFIFYPEFLTKDSLRYYRGQIDWAVKEADRISADSEATRRDLIERIGVEPAKVTTIHLAASPVYIQAYTRLEVMAALQNRNLPEGFLLCVGTLEPRKNLPTLIRAFAQLLHSGDVDVPLVLVGGRGWKYEEVFDTIREQGIEKSVVHLSGVGDSELAKLYHGAGVLLTPSYYEGFGLPALEAMHCGCPIVVSNRGSLIEVAGDAGILLEPEDIDGWSAAILKVLEDSELRNRMVESGYAQASKFSWQATAQKTLSLYINN